MQDRTLFSSNSNHSIYSRPLCFRTTLISRTVLDRWIFAWNVAAGHSLIPVEVKTCGVVTMAVSCSLKRVKDLNRPSWPPTANIFSQGLRRTDCGRTTNAFSALDDECVQCPTFNRSGGLDETYWDNRRETSVQEKPPRRTD